MSKYDKVKFYYDNGNWTIEQVLDAVIKGWITAAQFEEITEVPYEK